MPSTTQKPISALVATDTFQMPNGQAYTLTRRDGDILYFTEYGKTAEIKSNPPGDTVVTVLVPDAPTPTLAPTSPAPVVTEAQAAANVVSTFPGAAQIEPLGEGKPRGVTAELLADAFEAFAKALRGR